MATWFAVVALLLQVLVSAGAVERPMAPVQAAGDGIVICTEHGFETLPSDGGPAHPASDHSAPSCPCCLPLAAGNGLILSEAPQLATPVVLASSPLRVPAAAPRPFRLASDPQQPRAPPLSI